MLLTASLLFWVASGQVPNEQDLTPPPPPPNVSDMPAPPPPQSDPNPPPPPQQQAPPQQPRPQPQAPQYAPQPQRQPPAGAQPPEQYQPAPQLNAADANRRATLLDQRERLEEDRPSIGVPIALMVIGGITALGGLAEIATGDPSCIGVSGCQSSSDYGVFGGVFIAAGIIAASVGILILVIRSHERSSVDEQLQQIDGELMELQQKMAPPQQQQQRVPPQQQQQQPPPPASPTMAFLFPAIHF